MTERQADKGTNIYTVTQRHRDKEEYGHRDKGTDRDTESWKTGEGRV